VLATVNSVNGIPLVGVQLVHATLLKDGDQPWVSPFRKRRGKGVARWRLVPVGNTLFEHGGSAHMVY
jgi:hypothetical protein